MSKSLAIASLAWFSFGCPTATGADPGWLARDVEVIVKDYEQHQVEYFWEGSAASQAIGINKDGCVIGFVEVATHSGTVFKREYFFGDEKGLRKAAVPKDFTNVELNALSDSDVVVGRATRPLGHAEGSIRGLVWYPKEDKQELVPLPPGFRICDLQSISSNGERITGYSTGDGKLMPTVWDWDAAGKTWIPTVLESVNEHNPFIVTAQVMISPDGNTIAGCCTEVITEAGIIDSSLYIWKRSESGRWVRSKLLDDQLYIRGMNNKGQMVGSISDGQNRRPCLVQPEGKLILLSFLPGDVQGEAQGINEDSTIVGWSDGEHGSDDGPVPCYWNTSGEASPLKLSDAGYGFAFAINQAGQIAGSAEIEVSAPASAIAEENSAMLAVRATPRKQSQK